MKSARSSIAELNWPLCGVVCSIVALGCYNLHSAAAAHDPRLYITQIGWFGLGCLICAVCLSFDYRLTESLAYIVYAVVCSLLVAVLLAGKQAMGARRWLVLGPLTFQPSELAKVATMLCMARYFSHRVERGGYTIEALARPLNPTRPLACILLLVFAWDRPFLADPIGELARGIHRQLGCVSPPLQDLLWFRALLIGSIVATSTVLMVWLTRAERAATLLHPWPAGRKRHLLTAVILAGGAATALLCAAWERPGLTDPFGMMIAALNTQAQPGGLYANLRPGWTLRLTMVGFLAAYALASVDFMRRSVANLMDILVAPLDILVVPALMTLVQPDLGTAGIIILIGMTIILVAGVRLRSLLMMGVGAALIGGVAWFGALKDYQKRRILTFIDPEQDVQGAGWNAVQSLIAVGSGRFFGKGHMGGTQTQLSFLPEQHTDFAFSVWAEEQGFIGCLVLLTLYLILLTLAFAIAAEARDTYGTLLATGIAALILWQAIINIGMVIGVLPVVGLTLPLFSYGGSSVLTIMMSIGLLLNIHWRRRAH